MNIAVKIPEIFAAMSNQRSAKRCPRFFGNFNRTGNEKFVVRYHAEKSNAQRSTSNYKSCVPSISHEVLLECDAPSNFIVALLGSVDETNQRDLLPK